MISPLEERRLGTSAAHVLRYYYSMRQCSGGGGGNSKKTSWAQEKTSGKFEFLIKKKWSQKFKKSAQDETLKREDQTSLKIAKYFQDYSYLSGALFVSPGRFPVDFCGTSQVPA